MFDLSRLVDDASELIAIRSTADRPAELRRALDFVLDRLGPAFTVERFEANGKPSALAYATSSRPAFRVILNAHLDVVPAPPEQFRARRDGDRLYGRGAQDMKVAALVLAEVFRRHAADLPYPLGLQLVTDEEVGGFDGTAHQIDQGVTAGFVIIGEQSGLRVVAESKGLLHVRLVARGVAAHAAYPWLGDNALLTLTAAVGGILDRYPVPAAEQWVTTVNVARIETTNTAVNQVPARRHRPAGHPLPAGRCRPARPQPRGGRGVPLGPGRRPGRGAGRLAGAAASGRSRMCRGEAAATR